MKRSSSKSVGRSLSKRARAAPSTYGENERDISYDHFFDKLNSSNSDQCAANTNAGKAAGAVAHQSVGLSSSKEPEVEHPSCASAEHIAKLNEMVNTINYLNDQIKSLGEEVRLMKEQPSLLIDDGDIKDGDLPFLSKVEAFNLPIREREHLEQLENMLGADKSFYLFFVC